MKLIDKYILKSYLYPFFCCMAAFSMLFVIWDLFDNLSKFLDSQTPPALIATYYGCLLLPSLEYIAPASSLLGTLYALWNFTRGNELTAFRASGVSLYRMMVPFVAAAFVISLCAALVKETVAPSAIRWVTDFEASKRTLAADAPVTNLAYYNNLARRQWIVEAFRVDDPSQLERVTITQENEEGKRVVTYTAERAEWLDGRWWLFDPARQYYDDSDNPRGDPEPLAAGGDVILELPELTEAPSDFVYEMTSWEELSTLEMWRYIKRHPGLEQRDLSDRLFMMHNRLALPWACFVVTIFGIPAGARSARQNAVTGVFIALGFFFAFYFLSHIGLVLGKSGTVDPWLGAWLSNMVFIAVGGVMLARMR